MVQSLGIPARAVAQAVVELTARFEGGGCMLEEKVAIVVKPAFGFEKGEEEAAGCAEESEFKFLRSCGGASGRRCQLGDRALESVIESIGERVAFEDVGEACVSEDVVRFRDCRECA